MFNLQCLNFILSMWLLRLKTWDWIIPVTLSEFLITKNSLPLSVCNLLNKLFLQKKLPKLLWNKLSFIATILAHTWIDNYPSHKRKRNCIESWKIIAHILHSTQYLVVFQNLWKIPQLPEYMITHFKPLISSPSLISDCKGILCLRRLADCTEYNKCRS